MKEMPEAWYLLYTKPRKELMVETKLNLESIKVFCPMMQECKWEGGRTISNIKPLFPGYLFVNLSLLNDYYRVKWTPGVNRFISFGDCPVSV